MSNRAVRCGWVGRLGLLATVVSGLLTGCATATVAPTPVVQSEDDDYTQLVTLLRVDLNRYNKREAERQPAVPAPKSAQARDTEFARRARELFAPLAGLRMPVVGVRHHDLDDSWGAPRDGGDRRHRGIDIFAPRGTAIVAVMDGIISFIGEQPKGGHCIWLTTESGTSFYYAHLDRWAPGLYEGMEVQSGDLLGYVGNTGNALTTPPHLHFGINQNDEMVNPYPVLTRALLTRTAHRRVEVGSGYAGTR